MSNARSCVAGVGHPLVLLYGSGPGATGTTNFASNIGPFANQLPIDMPGWGESDTQTAETGRYHLGALIAVLDALGIESAALAGLFGRRDLHRRRDHRRRTAATAATHGQAVVVQQHVKAAITLLDALTARDLTLATAGQGDLDTWLSGAVTHRREAGHFIRWAHRQKLTRLEFAAARWGGPTGVIDTEARWQQARRLIHDDTIRPEDRVAGLLVLLYAQWPAAISRLTLDHVHAGADTVRLHLGPEPVVLPEPLAALVRELVNTRSGHAVLGDPGTSRWLFPGGQPGRPISAYQLGDRLRQLGLRPAQSRSTALFALATDLPAALLARMLGIHISVAVAWQRASNGDWANYAAAISRRTGAAATETADAEHDTPY